MSERPRIEIDNEGIRFIDDNGQRNLFWCDLFAPSSRSPGFHVEVMLNIRRLYEECVRGGYGPIEEPEESEANG